jgi:predicted PurR-regulated permease PerM
MKGGKAVGGIVLSSVGGLAKNTIDLVFDFFVVLFTLFFLFRDGHHLYNVFHEALPIESSYKTHTFERIDNEVVAIVRGTLLTALA